MLSPRSRADVDPRGRPTDPGTDPGGYVAPLSVMRDCHDNGQVFHAVHETTQQTGVMKRILEDCSGEVRLHRGIVPHDNVVSLIDVIQNDNGRFIVMELAVIPIPNYCMTVSLLLLVAV